MEPGATASAKRGECAMTEKTDHGPKRGTPMLRVDGDRICHMVSVVWPAAKDEAPTLRLVARNAYAASVKHLAVFVSVEAGREFEGFIRRFEDAGDAERDRWPREQGQSDLDEDAEDEEPADE